jgi:hypothetical protein
MSAVLTKYYDAVINSEELISTTEYLMLQMRLLQPGSTVCQIYENFTSIQPFKVLLSFCVLQ